MQNKLADLNNYLFQALEEVQTAETKDELDVAIKKGKTVANISKGITEIASLQLQAAIQLRKSEGLVQIPEVIGIGHRE